MRKRILYFDMEKIDQNDEPLCESEQEVAGQIGRDPKPDIFMRLDMEAALQKLTPRQREAIGLLAHGHTEQEIAETMGISQQGVHNLLTKARSSLQKNLQGGL